MRLYDEQSRFTTGEFRCRCECGFGSHEKDIDPTLIEKLNMLRRLYGKALVVVSGARCVEYNRSVGGVENSAHLPHSQTKQCRAVDIYVVDSADRYTLVDYALRIGFNRIGLAKTFLHLDVAWDLEKHIIFNY